MNSRLLAALGMLVAPGALAAEGDVVEAELRGDGITGTVRMVETASGVIGVTLRAEGVPSGAHGFHIHQVGRCDAADGFESAGGHVAEGLDHGIMREGGPHPGDLPNVHAEDNGIVHAEFFTRGFSLGRSGEPRILDDDGAAVVLHAGPDDYASQPSGNAGNRIACGVLEPAE